MFRANNSRWVEDGSYLAIKNVTLGYTVPFTGNAYISKARFYVTGQQLAVFSKYNGMNPEVALDSKMSWKGLGVDRTTYPVPRSFSIGCNITF